MLASRATDDVFLSTEINLAGKKTNFRVKDTVRVDQPYDPEPLVPVELPGAAVSPHWAKTTDWKSQIVQKKNFSICVSALETVSCLHNLDGESLCA